MMWCAALAPVDERLWITMRPQLEAEVAIALLVRFIADCSTILDEATDDPQRDRLQIRIWVGDDARHLPLRIMAVTDLGAVRADLIVVIEHGHISQIGTHAELMSKGGKYRSMVEQQIHMTLGNFTTPTEMELGALLS